MTPPRRYSSQRASSVVRYSSIVNPGLEEMLQGMDLEKFLRFGVSSARSSISSSQSTSISTPGRSYSPENLQDVPIRRRSTTHKAPRKKRRTLPALTKQRIGFLSNLHDQLNEEERDFLHAMFNEANPSGSGYISITEMSCLLSSATRSKFSLANCRKIMKDVDLDEDGNLSLLDILSVLYMTELHLVALADGFRKKKLIQASAAFTASHALVFIALSELCSLWGLRLEEMNIFLNMTTRIQENSTTGPAHPPAHTIPTLFCMSLLGQGHSFFDTIWLKLSESTTLRMDSIDNHWPTSDFIVPIHKRHGGTLLFPVLNKQLSQYPRMPYMVRKNSVLANDPIPPIHIRARDQKAC
ncbi:uncharacterized protein [Watersipora subatra]|uniref:uncharacterized protein n=1 Tax=Watersipora subatra TaxID=2589382 RepID=UPI00355C7B7A